MPNNQGDCCWMNRPRDFKDMLDKWPSRETMKDLRQAGLHSCALSGGQNDDVEVGSHHHLSLDLFLARSITEYTSRELRPEPCATRRTASRREALPYSVKR